MPDLFKDIIPSILQTKKSVVGTDSEGDYVPFVINRALSFHYDCVMQVNEMNKLPSADRILQYQFLLNTIRSYKRPFQKWQKREDIDGLDAVKEYYNYSNEKAKDAMSILSDDDIMEIKKRINKGGLNAKHKRFSRGDAGST